MLTDKLKRDMLLRTFSHKLYRPDRPPHVSHKDVEPDGRKQKKAIAALQEAGYIEAKESDGGYGDLVITPKVFDDLPLPVVDMPSLWTEQGKKEERHKKFSFLLIAPVFDHLRVPPEALKAILHHHDMFEWFVVNNNPVNYHTTFNEAEHLCGPFTLPEAQAKWKELTKDERLDDKWQIVVSSKVLRDYIANLRFEENYEYAYKRNLSWGLVSLGIITENESKLVQSGDDIDGISLVVGSAKRRMGNPDEWGDRVRDGITSVIDKIGDLSRVLAVYRKIELGVADYGGWEKFRTDYGTKLRAALLEKHDGKATTEEAA